ncbi:hypothetical protein OS493_001337 [Desmophyllum pertusum]|uniref:Uncharacterized protein n=1 Tax=Desmophyllum pertusum TaxID=174260 RepID=A0A9X0CZI0_9CNID|nr:hypothetical protein OS493_001337 [Desmophyllum pertusum]
MLVARHKRAKDGPAILGMMPDLQDLMELYVRNVRPQFAKAGVDHLFVTVEGTLFPDGTIGRRVSAFFEKTKLRIGARLAHINVRKFVTTKTREEETPAEAAIVQRLMSYSAKTAERSYVRINLTRLGADALDIIQRVTSVRSADADVTSAVSDEPTVEPSADADVPSAVARQPTGEPSADADVPSAVARQPTGEPSADADVPSAVAHQPSETESSVSCSISLVSAVVIPPTPQKQLTDRQKEAVRTLFDADIKQHKKLSLIEVKSRCCTSPLLRTLSMQQGRVKQVSRVGGWLDDFDEPSTRSSGKRESWDNEDSTLLEQGFKEYSSLPSTSVIRGALNSDEELRAILDREGWQRTYTKIKNIFKKKARK